MAYALEAIPRSRGVHFELGQHIGDLIVIEESADRPHGVTKGRAWICECICGRRQVRTTSQLNRSLRHGRAPQCPDCLKEYRAGLRHQRADYARERLLELWEMSGTLYSTAWEESETETLREIFHDEFGPFGDSLPSAILEEFGPLRHDCLWNLTVSYAPPWYKDRPYVYEPQPVKEKSPHEIIQQWPEFAGDAPIKKADNVAETGHGTARARLPRLLKEGSPRVPRVAKDALRSLIRVVRDKYPDVDQDGLKEILTQELEKLEKLMRESGTIEPVLAEGIRRIDERVNKELRAAASRVSQQEDQPCCNLWCESKKVAHAQRCTDGTIIYWCVACTPWHHDCFQPCRDLMARLHETQAEAHHG